MSMTHHDRTGRRPDPAGWMAGVAAFVLWGLLPAYWKGLQDFDPLLVVAHRVLWSLGVLVLLLAWRKRLGATAAILRRPRLTGLHLVAAILLGSNWWLYIHATLTARILEGALGYFLNPLVTLVLARLFLGERLSRAQLAAAGLAAAGVALQVVAVGSLPWIALLLAVTFSFYGLVRKQSPLGAVEGTAIETALAAPAALWIAASHDGWGFAQAGAGEAALLCGSGLATTVPLLLFTMAARRIPLGLLGMLQFVSPTLQFLVGWLAYGEPLSPLRLASFALIWAGVGLYVAGLRVRNARSSA